METTGTLRLGNENFEFPIIEGTEGEKALDTRTLRAKSGHIMFDEGYGNTGSCLSNISFIDGEKASCVTAAIRSNNWLSSPLS